MRKITHLLKSVPNQDTEILKIICDIFYYFLRTERAQINESVIVKQYFEVELNMINSNAFSQTLKKHMVKTYPTKREHVASTDKTCN